ncbi:hypothetical protein HanIR_Chr10g0461521 [Helianthus annuus]|nr:hypothetical protein HanIR_Chr10g0461521 [Helianthus annuus]
MSARKDLAVSYSRLTQEEVEKFCMEWGIGLKFKPVAPGMDVSIDQCPAGSIALYCRHFEFSNLRHPFSLFVLNVLEYYRVSFGQIHPQGLARVLHFENGDWFTFETSKANVCLVSSTVTTLGAWKDRFFWVSDEILPSKMVWRRTEAILNEPEPSASEINSRFLEIIRECPSRVRPFPEQLLVLLGISKVWDKPNRGPVLMRDGHVMSALEFIKSDDTSDVAFADVQDTPGENTVFKGSEQRFEGSGYVGVPDVKGFKKAIVPKVVRRSNRPLNTSSPPSTPEHVDLSDDIGVSVDHALDEGVDKEKELVITGKKSVGKGVVMVGSSGKSVSGSEGLDPHQVYVPDWGVKLGDSFKDATVYEDVLSHIAPPLVHGTIAEMDDDMMLSRMILSTCNLAAMLSQGVARFRKRMHEYEEFPKKKDKMKATVSTLKKENEGLVKKGETLSKKVEELTQKHEAEVSELKKKVEALEALRLLLTSCIRLNLTVFWVVYMANFWSMGGIRVMLPGYKACQSGDSQDKSSLYRPEALKVFQDSVREIERLTYPYVGEVSKCFGKHISVLQDLKPRGLDEVVCKEVLGSLSKKRSCSGDSEDTFSGAGEGSKDPSLEASGTAVEEGKKKKKKAKKAKGDEAGASKPVLGWLQAFKASGRLYVCSLKPSRLPATSLGL